MSKAKQFACQVAESKFSFDEITKIMQAAIDYGRKLEHQVVVRRINKVRNKNWGDEFPGETELITMAIDDVLDEVKRRPHDTQ